MQISHDSQDLRYRSPGGAVETGTTVTLNLYAPGCLGASVRLWQEGKGETMVPMTQSAALFRAEIKVPEDPCILWYFFVANYGEKIICYGNNPESLGGEGCVYENSQPPSFQITVYDPFEVPSWYKDALVYQIFPDRFYRGADYFDRVEAARLPGSSGETDGSPSWKGASRSFPRDWYQLPHYVKDDAGNVIDWEFYGGTLNGIREKIPYLKSMGVTALYLNPIFKAASNHRYDTADYMQIDPLLGDESDFCTLASECKKNGIRIILDGVFSHTGADSIYFDKYGNYERAASDAGTAAGGTSADTASAAGTAPLGYGGAYLHEDSPYRNWYRFRDEAPGYECWWGVSDLPNVEETDPTYDKFICGEDGVLDHWLKLGASGFRLDVADELPDSFIQHIHDRIKTDPDQLLLGEVWEDASNKYSYGQLRTYFSGHELDGTMNYPFRDSGIDYCIGKESAEMFCRKMKSMQENYPKEAFYSSLNLIGGHDCERILSVLGSFTPASNDHYREDGTFMPAGAALYMDDVQYRLARERLKMLSALQYVMPGVPCVYYGDEAGVQGNRDPDNRRTYPWGREDGDLLYHYRMLGLIYESNPVLKDGAFAIAHRDNCIFLLRYNEKDLVLTVVNASPEKKYFTEKLSRLFGIEFKNRFYNYALELLTSKTVPITEDGLAIGVAGYTAMIIKLQKDVPKPLELPRASGVLCHLSSIPGSDTDGAGALGKAGRAFVDWLADSGFKLWQILPVNPAGADNSPYFSPCVFAGDTRYIDYSELPDDNGFETFCSENAYWLDDWAAYAVDASGFASSADPKRDQYYFFTQLQKLREYANSKGISLIGDLPIYTTFESVDLKAHPESFQLDENGRPLFVGGVPPDYFSEAGQYWSNPLYNWDNMKQDHYEWWYQRLRQAIRCFDYVRLDHFRSFSEYFAIPEGQLPITGTWQQGPGMDFFHCMKERLHKLPIIAEDLGLLDSGVFNLLKETGFPGMNIWQFSDEEMKKMDGRTIASRIFYSGTHDNQTLVGWCADNYPDTEAKEKASDIIHWLMESRAPWVIFPLQDILLLGDEARMNIPGTIENNWGWKCTEELPEINMSR